MMHDDDATTSAAVVEWLRQTEEDEIEDTLDVATDVATLTEEWCAIMARILFAWARVLWAASACVIALCLSVATVIVAYRLLISMAGH